MATFTIQRGAVPLGTWHLRSGLFTPHSQVDQREGVLILAEESRVCFVLAPATADTEYRISIGDVPVADITPHLGDPSGSVLDGKVFWREGHYFDSARGHTPIVLESRRATDAGGKWDVLLTASVYVLPSKLGEDRYEAMTRDLQRISYSLLTDLYGKSRRTAYARYAAGPREQPSREAELRAIEDTLQELGDLLQAISRRPASRTATVIRPVQYWGGEKLHHSTAMEISRRGSHLASQPRPVRLSVRSRVESFDVPEHQLVAAILEMLHRRCLGCAAAAAGHARAIAAERHLRDFRVGDAPSLYERIDQPRINRLRFAEGTARRCAALALSIRRLPFLEGVQSRFLAVRGGMFQRNDEYRSLLAVIRRFLSQHGSSSEDEDKTAIAKLTWRVYEQWVFMQVVDAFRKAGVELDEWREVIRQNLQSRFLVDFDRGLTFEGAAGPDLRIRFRYEPWIFSRDVAEKSSESLYRGGSGKVAWSPDIVIECMNRQNGSWSTTYAIVLDCKYTSRLSEQHWTETGKYLEIRSTASRRQVAKQLWLVTVGDESQVQSEDPDVTFDASGPSCDEHETVRYRLSASPATTESPPKAPDGFSLFAEGTLAFLRRMFA